MKFSLIAILMLAPLSVPAQSRSSEQAPTAKQVEVNPVSNAVRNMLARESKIIVAAAEEMPAEKYSYHPTPAQMTFGHLIAHLSQSNNFLCSKTSGAELPADPKLVDTDPKDKLVDALRASFDYCTQVLAKVDDSNLGEQVTLFGNRTVSRAGAMFTLANDFFDHYSTEAMYLRLNGLLPPTAQAPKP